MHEINRRKINKKIWIDLDNSPHVPFFAPIIKRLTERGIHVEITARDCFQVCGLAEYYNLNFTKIGRHFGKHTIIKVVGTLIRTAQLIPFAYKRKPDIAISHGSRAMMIAASFLRIPFVLLFDYEFTQAMPLITPILLMEPDVLKKKEHHKKGNNLIGYPGIKEDVYVPFFKPDASIKKILGLKENEIIVTIRPPATEAHYHNPESEVLFAEVMNMLGSRDGVKMVILPRNEVKQTAWVKEIWPHYFSSGKAVIPSKVVDGLNLMWHSDLVISGGGTMNREAAALGVPVYSIFRGKIGAVDRYLSENSRLCLLTSKEDVRQKIKVQKRIVAQQVEKNNSAALDTIVGAVVGLIEKGKA
jgi:uncharacterized protein